MVALSRWVQAVRRAWWALRHDTVSIHIDAGTGTIVCGGTWPDLKLNVTTTFQCPTQE